MKVRLDRLGDEPYIWQEALALSRDDLGHPDVIALSEVAASGSVSLAVPGFHLHVSLSYEQTLACTRCLGEITSPVETRFDLLVTVEGEDGSEELVGERQLAGDDLGTLALPSPLLDTRPLIVEQMQLNVPMKSLCREDCAGLCADCGADLNAGPCECRPAADPRWAALAKLQDRSGT